MKEQGAEGWEKRFYEGFGNRRFVGKYASLCMLIRKWWRRLFPTEKFCKRLRVDKFLKTIRSISEGRVVCWVV